MPRVIRATALAASLAALFSMGSTVIASGGDFSLDLVAAAPFSYNHTTGGGAFNDRTVGRFDDVVESLEGGDFACGDIVTFLTQVKVRGTAIGAQSIRLNFTYTASSTGQQGVALIDNDVVGRGVSAAINTGATDAGTVDDGGSTATVVPGSEIYDGVPFIKPTLFYRSIIVNDLEAGETVVVRHDVTIACNNQTPTGNMQVRLVSASVTSPQTDAISVGAQTVPFKHVGDIKCDPKDPKCN